MIMIEMAIDMAIEQNEVPDLRQAVGWIRRDEDYPSLLAKCSFGTGVRDEHRKLVGFGYIAGPGLEHGYMEDTIVHPDYQRQGIGQQIVQSLLQEAERRLISTITVTYEKGNQPFSVRCGFAPCPAGIWQKG